MANAVVAFAIQTLSNILTEEASLLSGVRGEVEEMQKELKWMQCFLKEAEKRTGLSDLVRNGVSEIREVTYDIEDLIERLVLKSALRNDQEGVVKCSYINRIVELHQVGSRINAINARLTRLVTRLKTYDIRALQVGGEGVAADEASATVRRKGQDYSHVPDHNVVGLDEKITELVESLIHVGGRPSPASVVCLHGMGGVGKTTTAKKVYSDSRIKAHFEGFAWVSISQQFNPRKVWESILSQLSGDVKSMSDDELASKLWSLQKERRCLVVIDDIWSSQDWVNLSAALPYKDQDTRSKMLLTTRNEGLASHGVHVYRTNLNVLDHNNSLRLLTNTILFQDHPMKEDSEMQKYAGEMVKRCGGLPLAIKVLGGILAKKHYFREWERVGANIKLVLKRGDQQQGLEGVSSILESSYEDLPYNLRSCFLYFSQYPEGEEITATELKQKWMGEGFVSPSVEEGDETMEDIAEDYLHELVRRCMIQAGVRGHTGRVKTCRIHDLMRDLCISKAKEEGFAHSIKLGAANVGTNFKKVSFRRLCISSGNHELVKLGDLCVSKAREEGFANEGTWLKKVSFRRLCISSGKHKVGESVLSSLGPQLRSIWFEGNLDDEQCKEAVLIVEKLKLVRVLELSNTMWTLLGKTRSGTKHIENLIHLRFLNLQVSMLPSSIGNLICLQTLNLARCESNLIIPDSVWQMEQLRHLYLPQDGCVCESRKQHVGDFKNLRTLVNFPPENFDLEQNLVKFINVRKLVIIERYEEICKILKRSPGMVFNRAESLSFRNSVNIFDYKFMKSKTDFESVIRSCPSLYRLVVDGTINFLDVSNSPGPPSCSAIWPSNLTKLVLRNSGIDEYQMRLLGKLQRLKVLFLYGNALMSWVQLDFSKYEFPQLRHLVVEELTGLSYWVVREGGLPSLYCLEIVNCRELKSAPVGFQYLKQLKELKVTSMPYVFRKRLERGGDDWERVRHVPSISFSRCYREKTANNYYTDSDILDESSSLELLKKTILFSGEPDHPIRGSSKMDRCGIEMVKICGGVRVAISILGGILGRKHEIEEWESIKSVLKEGNDVVAGLLELSYADLPDDFKSRFLYFAQHETNERIKTSEMIQRWIGEGFITSSMEDVNVAQELLNELVSGGLIEVGERSHTGRVKSYRMHEFVRHFCVSKAKEEGFASLHRRGLGDDEGTVLEKVKFRRLCIYPGGIISSSLVEIIPQRVSVWFQYPWMSGGFKLNDKEGKAAKLIIRNLKSVKVLTLPVEIWSSLDERGRERIGNLVELAFLKLGASELPKSFGNLRCLQTLNLELCGEDLVIPDSVWRMRQLRHLYLPKEGCKCETSTQPVGDFPELLTLVNFPPCNFDLEQNLVKFTSVRKLVITDLVRKICSVMGSQEIVFERLQSLSCRLVHIREQDLEVFARACPCLYRLSSKGSTIFPASPRCTPVWPSNLTKLVLEYTKIDGRQLGSVAKLQSLKVLFLQQYAFGGKEMVFHANDFPQLHHLNRPIGVPRNMGCT